MVRESICACIDRLTSATLTQVAANFKNSTFQNPEIKSLTDFKILAFPKNELQDKAGFKILGFQTPEFKILALQNLEFRILET